MIPKELTIQETDEGARTIGLGPILGFDLQIDVRESALRTACANLVRFLGGYFIQTKAPLNPGERIDWASSLLVAKRLGDGLFGFDELDFDGTSVRSGADQTVAIWNEQSAICKRLASPYVPSKYGEQIAVSPGVLESKGVLEGIRYAAPPPMSGWWLFAEEYDGDKDQLKSMFPAHTFHVLAQRPEVAKFLALGVGFAFKSSDLLSGSTGEQIWYETDVATQPPP